MQGYFSAQPGEAPKFGIAAITFREFYDLMQVCAIFTNGDKETELSKRFVETVRPLYKVMERALDQHRDHFTEMQRQEEKLDPLQQAHECARTYTYLMQLRDYNGSETSKD